MDDIDDFFDFSKPFKRTVVSGGYLNGRTLPEQKFETENLTKREVLGKEYAKNVVAAEQIGILDEMYSEIPGTSKTNINSSSFMDTMDYSDDDDDQDIKQNCLPKDDVYDKYNFLKRESVDLPIFDSKDKFLELIKENRIVILEGDTGCGKTTQIPQIILDDAYKNREYCNIICTQPRRIAAISIAQRVCQERNWRVGTLVGYQVGLHKEIDSDTRLLYCTTGVLLQKLIKTKTLSAYTHLILDEVHERDQDMDFLLIVIKKLIQHAPNTKIILMSATINTKEFSDYFQTPKGKILVSAPILKVDARRLYNVKDFYIEDLKKITSTYPEFKMNFDDPSISDVLYKIVLKLIINLEIIDQGDDESQRLSHKPSVLIFLPGINEIDKMEKTLENLKNLNAVQISVLIVRLHSMVSPDEQQKAFRKPAPGYRKIILATNIAESSITVPDVKYVIDFCLTKNLIADTNTSLTSLQLDWASRANCKQRAGRAGRVMNGRVFRLVSKCFYNNCMSEHGSPEMIRCPLENIVLKAKLLDMGKPKNILGLALDPPNLSDIRNTILILKESGALYQTKDGFSEIDDGELTLIGKLMAQLPIDIHVTRLIIFGYIFSILEETIIIAAGLNVKSIFDFPYQYQLSAYTSKLTWSDGSGSDLFAIICAYRVWVSKYEQQQFQREDAEHTWSRRFFINSRSMREMHYLIIELKSRLNNIGIKENTGYNRVNWLDHEKSIVLKIAIAGAFYPNYFTRANTDQYDSGRAAYQTLCGRNPCNTVYFSGFDNKYIGQLYVKSIKDIFKKAMIAYKNIEVTFEEGTQKIFVKFNNDSIDDISTNINNLRLSLPGRVLPEVYKAIKMRQLRLPTSIKVMPSTEAAVYACEKKYGKMVDGEFRFFKTTIKKRESVLPSVFTKFERGKISYIENCGKFWFQPNQVENQLKQIKKELSINGCLFKFSDFTQIKRGMLVAAKYKGRHYRGKVLRKEEESKLCSIRFKVILIDYGDVVSLDIHYLYGIKENDENTILFDSMPRAFECYLAGIAPSAINCTTGMWSVESSKFFQEIIRKEFEEKKQIELEIYSVVNGISAVLIHIGPETLNDILVKKNFAQFCEENYLSKIDNDLRSRKQCEQMYKDVEYFNKTEEDINEYSEDNSPQYTATTKEQDFESPPASKCTIKLDLRGPLSPLETVCYSATRIGTFKKVRIERDSVNSVLLNSDPQDNCGRLIVAATVSESAERDVLTARQTTVMPNIKGFAPIMALIFCPKMEIRRNVNKTKFSSLLCGLGSKGNNSKESLFAEHDVFFNLHVEIVENDLEIINQIRYSMDTILSTNPGEDIPKISHKNRCDLTAKIKELLIKLLEKDRQEFIEVENTVNEMCWNQIDLNDMHGKRDIYGDQAIFPLHDCMRLYSEPYENIENLRKNCEELYVYKKLNLSTPDNLKCELCGQTLTCIMQLRIHLLSKLHQNREKQINFKKK